jgi:hypothetical protein
MNNLEDPGFSEVLSVSKTEAAKFHKKARNYTLGALATGLGTIAASYEAWQGWHTDSATGAIVGAASTVIAMFGAVASAGCLEAAHHNSEWGKQTEAQNNLS